MYLKSLKITSEKRAVLKNASKKNGHFQNQGLTLREEGFSDLPLDIY